MLLNLLLIGGITYAAFMDKGSILGTTFSVGSSDIKLLQSVASGTEESNLADEIAGPSFTNITPYWQQNYYLKIYNNASSKIALLSNANYETAQDPQDLRQIIFIEPIEWNDLNENGIEDNGELGTSYGRKTLIKWKTEGINLGQIDKEQTKGFVLRFSTDSVSETKQGASGMFTFEFNATQVLE